MERRGKIRKTKKEDKTWNEITIKEFAEKENKQQVAN